MGTPIGAGQERYATALASGATATTGGDVVRHLQRSGLRLRKRRGDRPVGRIRLVPFPDGTVADVDLLISDRPATEPVLAALCFVQDADGRPAMLAVSRLPRSITAGTALECADTGMPV